VQSDFSTEQKIYKTAAPPERQSAKPFVTEILQAGEPKVRKHGRGFKFKFFEVGY
jgi:hypothetical protein